MNLWAFTVYQSTPRGDGDFVTIVVFKAYGRGFLGFVTGSLSVQAARIGSLVSAGACNTLILSYQSQAVQSCFGNWCSLVVSTVPCRTELGQWAAADAQRVGELREGDPLAWRRSAKSRGCSPLCDCGTEYGSLFLLCDDQIDVGGCREVERGSSCKLGPICEQDDSVCV